MDTGRVWKRNRRTAEKCKRRAVLEEHRQSISSAHRVAVLGSIGRSGSRHFFNRAKTALRSHGEYLACQRKDRTRNVNCTHLDEAALVAGVGSRALEAHMNDSRNMTGYFRWIKSMGSDESNARPSTYDSRNCQDIARYRRNCESGAVRRL
jgi:hypothetical protein